MTEREAPAREPARPVKPEPLDLAKWREMQGMEWPHLLDVEQLPFRAEETP